MQVSLSRRDMGEFDASAFATPEEKEMLLSIAKLDLSYNFLRNTKGLQCLMNLTELDISHNKLQSLSNLPLKLRRIDASYNNLAELEGLGPLAQLEYCDLSYNAIPTVATPGALPSTTAMRYLDLSHNRLASLSGVENCPGLHILKADSNLIRGVAAGNEHDELNNVESLRTLKSLRVVTLANNPVSKNRNTPGIQQLLPRFATLDGLPVAPAGAAGGRSGVSGSVGEATIELASEPVALSRQSDHNRQDSAKLSMVGSVEATHTRRDYGPSVDTGIANVTSLQSAAVKGPMFADDGRLLSPSRRVGAVGERLLSPKRLSSGRPSSHPHSSGRLASPSGAARPNSAETHTRERQHEMSGSQNHVERPRSADGRPASSHFSSTALRELTTSAMNESSSSRPRTPQSTSLKTKILPGQTVPLTLLAGVERGSETSKGYTSRSVGGRGAIDASVPAVEVQRLMEHRIQELERAVEEYKSRLSKAQTDNETLRMQLTQARETVSRQGKVNAILADANRELSSQGPPHAAGSRRGTPRAASPASQRLGQPQPADLPAAIAAQARQAPKVGWSPHVHHDAHARPVSASSHHDPSVSVSRSSSAGRARTVTPQPHPSPRTNTPRPSSRERSAERLGSAGNRPSSVQGLVLSSSKVAQRPLSPPQRSDRASRPSKSSAIAAAMYMKTKQADSRSGSATSPQQTADRILTAKTAVFNAEHPPHKRPPPPSSSGVASNYASLLARSGPSKPQVLRPSATTRSMSAGGPYPTQSASAHSTRPSSSEAKLRTLLADLSSPSRDLRASKAPASITPPRHRLDATHNSSSRNVSFGPSQFYSPPNYS